MLTAPDELWEAAVRQATVISRLAALDTAGVTAVDAAADELGLSRRQVYVLLGRWRAGRGVVSDLLPGRIALAMLALGGYRPPLPGRN